MNYYLLIFAFAGLLVSACNQTISNASTAAPVSTDSLVTEKFSQPKEIPLFKEPLPNEVLEYGLISRFYPIGWSANGKFAYVIEPADEACGCYMMDLVVVELPEGTVLSRSKYEQIDKDSTTPYNLQTVWNKYKRDFSSCLDSFSIIQTKKFESCEEAEIGAAMLNFTHANNAYQITSKTTTAPNKNFNENTITGVSIYLSKNGAKPELMGTKTYDVDAGLLAIDLLLVIYPDGTNQALLVYRVLQRGWEGPPNVNNFSLMGFKL